MCIIEVMNIDVDASDKHKIDFKILNKWHLIIEILYVICLEPKCWPSVQKVL